MSTRCLLASRQRWLLALTIVALIIAVWALQAWLVGDLPSTENLSAGTVAPSTTIYDRYGRVLYEIMDPHRGSVVEMAADLTPGSASTLSRVSRKKDVILGASEYFAGGNSMVIVRTF